MTIQTHADAARYETMRQAMVASQLRTNAVSDARVVKAMAETPREDFVPEASRDFAYLDKPVALADGRMVNLPMATGRLLTEAAIEPNDRVLLIGAATGYTAAVLSALAAEVVAVEEDAQLAATARTALAAYPNVTVVEGPLKAGHAAGAPYDVLVIDGAVEQVPADLVSQLRVGGQAVSGLIENGVTRLASGRRSEGGFGLFDFVDVDCVPLPGFAKPAQFSF